MKHMHFDGLYEIFEEQLFSSLIEEDETLFVCNVVDKYMLNLEKRAMLHLNFIDEIKEDAAEEVHKMLLKKIYGHHDIKQFRNSLKGL